jgi:serine/threonine protein kinase
MKIDKIIKNLIDEGVLKNPSYKYLSSGSNYQAFLIDKKYVLRILKENPGSKNRLEKAYKISRFLERNNIDYQQKVFFLDKKNTFLLSEYIEGEEVSLNSLDDKYLKDFCSKFREINSLEQKGPELNILEDSIQRLSNLTSYKLKNIIENKNYLEIKEKDDIFNYIKRELVKLKKEYETIDWGERRVFFDHGDLAGANILLNKKTGEIRFIDWDNAKFTKDVGLILANMFFYCSDISESFQDRFIKEYNQDNFTGFSNEELKREVKRGLKLIVLSGIIWALSAAIKSKDENKDSYFEYLKTANDRLAVFKKII